MSDPSCRIYRELLGVYVVGAIEPHERAAVDDHLAQCYECREELAGLASLPALLRRVPADEAEKILAAPQLADASAAPSPELLDSLLAKTAAKRRAKRVRAMFTAAAAVLIAVGGAAAATEALTPSSSTTAHGRQHLEISTASLGPVTATVRYGERTWGTSMSVRVTGLPKWTNCKFYVVTKDGRRALASAWTVGQTGGQVWYPVAVGVSVSHLSGFVLVAAHHHPLQIPAT